MVTLMKTLILVCLMTTIVAAQDVITPIPVVSAAQVQAVIAARGMKADIVTDYSIEKTPDGPVLNRWKTAKLGAVPSGAELASITPTDITDAKEEAASDAVKAKASDKDQLALVALLVRQADPDKFDAMTPAEQIQAAQDAVTALGVIRTMLEKNIP